MDDKRIDSRSRFHLTARFCAAGLVALGLVVLSGWFLGIAVLASVPPSIASMTPNTAVLFVLTGISLWLADRRDQTPRLVLNAIIVALAGLSLVERWFNVHVGINQLVARQLSTSTVPDSISPASAVCFLLLGCATLLIDRARAKIAAYVCVSAVAAIAFISLCVFIFGVSPSYPIPAYFSLAIHTSVGFVVASIGFAMTRGSEGVVQILASDTIAGTMMRSILPGVIVLPVVLGWVRLTAQRAGLYDSAFATASSAASNVIALTGLLTIVTSRMWTTEQKHQLHQRALTKELEARAEARTLELRDSLSRYRTLFEESPLALWEADYSDVKRLVDELRHSGVEDLRRHFGDHPDLLELAATKVRILGQNRYCLKLFEAETEDELCNADTLGPHGYDHFRDQIVAFAGGQTSFETELERRSVRSRRLFMSLRVTIMPGHEQVWSRVVSSMVDLTEVSEAQQRLRDALRQQEMLMEAAPDAWIIVDRYGHILRINNQAERVFRCERAQLVGQPIELLIPEGLRQLDPDHQARFFADPDVRPMGDNLELYARRADGSEFPAEISLAPLAVGREVFAMASIRDVTERKAMQLRLQTSLSERELLLKEVHHRVKNNLAVISSLLYLESTYLHDQGVIRVFEDSQRRVRSMALVHERLYGSQSLSKIEFGQYARMLAEELLTTYALTNRIGLRADVQPIELGIDTAVPCGLILNELISNALKHAFSDDRSGTITVTLARASTNVCLFQVADDGIGMPATLDIDTHGSLGLRLIRSLVRQLSGILTVQRDRGTSVRVTFPLQPPIAD